MALTQGAVSVIKTSVQAAKKLLMKEFEAQLQQFYGIRPDGTCLLVEELTSRDAEVIETARLLRQRLQYLEEGIAERDKAAEAVRQLVREQAFTILNRFAAMRMAEERNIIRESIGNGYNSEGFQVYDQLTGGARTADQFLRYTWYIRGVFDELAIDLPAVFDRFSPYGLLFPSEKVVLELLEIINTEELSIYREPGQQPLNLWTEDETIGWIYQYYNSREEISEMRDASGAPRNSRELAVRNQFFTPRYVVQFLVDNSLGRQWYEMTKGQTSLTNICEYLVKREQEIFIGKGEEMPEARIEGAHYIEHRQLKDPRAISMLDPACGSMHFGLYCFDLFEHIYIEAWDNHQGLMQDLREQYVREDFLKQIPSFILRYNIHGVDIDPRAIQIAGLSLWLRAQKTYDNLNLQPAERPAISKSNLVVAEPLPGNENILKDFTSKLPGPIGKLVRVIWDKMKLAGETGLLLKIEEELKQEIEIAKQEWENYKNSSAQVALFDAPENSREAEMAAIYGKGQKITSGFFDKAEEQVLKALENFAENAEGDDAFQKLLFAEDTARGFAFIELCRKKYDVIVMNPPFGSVSINSKDYLINHYRLSISDLAAIFIDRMLNLNEYKGYTSAITTRTIFFIGGFTKWRNKLLNQISIDLFVDLGTEVLDALVDTSAFVLQNQNKSISSNFYRLIGISPEEQEGLLKNEKLLKNKDLIFNIDTSLFSHITNAPFCYWLDNQSLQIFKKTPKFESENKGARQGMKTGDNDRFTRNRWEVNNELIGNEFTETTSKTWVPFLLSDKSRRFYLSQESVVLFKDNGFELKNFTNSKGQLRSRPADTYNIFFKPGLSWSLRSYSFRPHIVPKGYIAQPGRVLAVFEDNNEILYALGLWNTKYYDYLIKLSMERADAPLFKNGIINNLPFLELDSVKDKIISISKKLYFLCEDISRTDDCGVLFVNNEFVFSRSLSDYTSYYMNNLKNRKSEYKTKLEELNRLVFNELKILDLEKERINKFVKNPGTNKEANKFDITEESILNRIFTVLVGCVFGRWDIRILKHWEQKWSDEDIFKARKNSPFLYGPKKSTLDLVLPEHHNDVEELWNEPYPGIVLEECVTVSDNNSIVSGFRDVLEYLWPETFKTVEEEFLSHFRVSELSNIFDNYSRFFDIHLKDYTRNKRISPIYWHLSIPSGRFNIWIYYPGLDEKTIYKLINKLVEPKIKEVKEEIDVLEIGSSSKELNDKKEFRDELIDFKNELLRVAQLPYKPNQNDGVLITAAPLHNLFQHSKWKKSTQATWKKLEKGDLDWAHLAYSIWPDRVQKKAKKDLSLAIAHGLEELCKIKPKEPKKKVLSEVKKENQMKIN